MNIQEWVEKDTTLRVAYKLAFEQHQFANFDIEEYRIRAESKLVDLQNHRRDFSFFRLSDDAQVKFISHSTKKKTAQIVVIGMTPKGKRSFTKHVPFEMPKPAVLRAAQS